MTYATSFNFEQVFLVFIGVTVVAPMVVLIVGSIIREFMGKDPWL